MLFSVTLAGTFVYDDEGVILSDPRVTRPGQWVKLLREPYFPYAPDPLWRPLPSLTYVAQLRLHGANALGFHLVNVLLHAGVSALVAELSRRMSGKAAVAWVAGLLFAAHPVHVEPVAMIVGRAEMLCSLGVVGGLVLFHGGAMTIGRVLSIVGCFLLAVVSKEHGLLLGPMLLACHLARRWESTGEAPVPHAERRGLLLLTALCCFVIFGYVAYRESIMPLVFDKWFMRWTVNPVVRSRGLDRVLVPLAVLGRYVGLLVFPVKLSPDYGANVNTYFVRWADPFLYLGATAVVAYLAGVALAVRRRGRVALACLLYLGLAYGFISNFVFVIGTVMGDRLIYLGSVFFIILVAAGLGRLPGRGMVALTAVLLVLASARTVTYAARWNDPLELFAAARRQFPRSVQLHVLEADWRVRRGQLDEAARVLEAGRQVEPESQNVWAWSEEVARRRGRDAEAQEYAKRAFHLAENPPHMPPRQNRAFTKPAGR